MEEKFYHNDFEDFIKDKAEQYKMYPSDKVWKGINSSLRSRRRWYWTGFVVLMSGVSYFAITELMSPVSSNIIAKISAPTESKPQVTTAQLIPFSSNITEVNPAFKAAENETVTSDLVVEDNGAITASFQIPMKFLPGNESASPQQKAAFLISGLAPLNKHEEYKIELSWPVGEPQLQPMINKLQNSTAKVILHPSAVNRNIAEEQLINWLEDHPAFRTPPLTHKRISWQLAFSPTVNYRKLSGSKNAKTLSRAQNIPMAVNIAGDVDRLVNHKPALGFELGTHGLIQLSRTFTLKAGVQFNYSKYDISAFRAPSELATIALNSSVNGAPSSLLSFTNIRNFGGSFAEDLKNQYYQFSLPVGFEVRLFGNDKLQFNIASTIQPTYLINRNTYLITTDFKNYTKAPSLVRRWNVNAGAEAYISYAKGDIKWQVGPQFRYQLLSSYQNEYPIKEYLMEYGIKVGITKTIR